MKMIREGAIDFDDPITANAMLELDGVLSFSIHNAGTATVTLDGRYTLNPGSTFSGGNPDANIVYSQKIRITFGTTGTKRLEVSTSRMKGGPYSNYEHKPQ